MSRISCKKCRRLGESLCGRDKCAFKRKPYPPGKLDSERKHKSVRSEFGAHLIEKQKVRNVYGVGEKQFSNYVKKAKEKKGTNPTETLYESLESRLDNIVFRLGLASSRALSRQLVSHGHIIVNGRKVTIPSYRGVPGDKISIREGSKGIGPFKELAVKLEKYPHPEWIKFDMGSGEALIQGKPKDANFPFNLSSVIEFYSR